MKNKRTIKNLVLGSSGYVGSAFTRFLEAKGEKVIPFDIKRSEKEDARFAKLPLKDVDRVYFIAWDVGGAKYLFGDKSQLIRQLEWNLKLLENVMPQLEKSEVPFFFLSSQYAEEYGTPYGSTKRLGEIWTRLLPNGVWARQWNVFGVLEEIDDRTKVISDFIHQAISTGVIKMMTNGKEERQFVHIEDSMRAYHKMISEEIKGGIYDITSGRWTSILEVADTIAKLTGAKVIPGTKNGASHKDMPSHDLVPGWKAEVSLEAGIKQMIDAYHDRMRVRAISPLSSS